MTKYFKDKTFKMAISATIAIIIANAFNLHFSVTAGIIAILSVQDTKKEALKVAGRRLIATTIAIFFSFVLYIILGNNPVIFGIFLLIFIPITKALKIGDGLVVVERKLLYNTNISMEKLIVEQLLKGIDGEENRNMAKASLPANTKLLNLYVKDGVCYVNFDENLLDQSVSVDEEIIIYSLVNSLTEIPTITKVQVSINGDSNRVFKENINLNTMFERNLEYVKD